VQTVAVMSFKQKQSIRDHDDVEGEAKRHLRQHQVQNPVDVGDAELIQRLTPVHQSEQETDELHRMSPLPNQLTLYKLRLAIYVAGILRDLLITPMRVLQNQC